jgi:CRISPR/Cas system-associated protein Cas10 (large subunit of type III CRISPR-Cas system)
MDLESASLCHEDYHSRVKHEVAIEQRWRDSDYLEYEDYVKLWSLTVCFVQFCHVAKVVIIPDVI